VTAFATLEAGEKNARRPPTSNRPYRFDAANVVVPAALNTVWLEYTAPSAGTWVLTATVPAASQRVSVAVYSLPASSVAVLGNPQPMSRCDDVGGGVTSCSHALVVRNGKYALQLSSQDGSTIQLQWSLVGKLPRIAMPVADGLPFMSLMSMML
jgi:hypothetical protein